jgi:hypothetical protein
VNDKLAELSPKDREKLRTQILTNICQVHFSAVGLSYTSSIVSELKKQTQAAAGESCSNLGTPQDPRAIVARIIQGFLGILGILLVVYVLYGGSLIFLSAGAEEKINEGYTFLAFSIDFFFLGDKARDEMAKIGSNK